MYESDKTIGQLEEELIRQINSQARIVCDEQCQSLVKREINCLLGSNEKIKHLTTW